MAQCYLPDAAAATQKRSGERSHRSLPARHQHVAPTFAVGPAILLAARPAAATLQPRAGAEPGEAGGEQHEGRRLRDDARRRRRRDDDAARRVVVADEVERAQAGEAEGPRVRPRADRPRQGEGGDLGHRHFRRSGPRQRGDERLLRLRRRGDRDRGGLDAVRLARRDDLRPGAVAGGPGDGRPRLLHHRLGDHHRDGRLRAHHLAAVAGGGLRLDRDAAHELHRRRVAEDRIGLLELGAAGRRRRRLLGGGGSGGGAGDRHDGGAEREGDGQSAESPSSLARAPPSQHNRRARATRKARFGPRPAFQTTLEHRTSRSMATMSVK